MSTKTISTIKFWPIHEVGEHFVRAFAQDPNNLKNQHGIKNVYVEPQGDFPSLVIDIESAEKALPFCIDLLIKQDDNVAQLANSLMMDHPLIPGSY